MRKTPRAFGLYLRALRLERDISQVDLSREAGLHRTYISLMERGIREPVLETLVALAAALNMTASVLLDGFDPDRRQVRLPANREATPKPRKKRR
jgi:transcriptional regulator with XRE-family HTH domain